MTTTTNTPTALDNRPGRTVRANGIDIHYVEAGSGEPLVLLAGASVFVRTYAQLRGVRLGYDTAHLMTARVYFAGKAYDAEDTRARAIDEIARRIATLPGAPASMVSDLVPLDDQGGQRAHPVPVRRDRGRGLRRYGGGSRVQRHPVGAERLGGTDGSI